MADRSRLASSPVTPPLVGRERELAALRDALDAALAGRGSLVLVGGEAGIGKTALAEAICAEAAARGATVLVGRCYDLSETPPYGPWAEAFARAPREGGVPPPDLAGGAAGGQGGPFARVRDALAALAARRPLALLLDDLHWADPASLDLLRAVARGLADLPVLLIAGYRADEVARGHPLYAALPLLVRESGATRIDLRPLGAADLRALVARYALPAADAARLADHLAARSDGNPLYAGELLRTLEEEGALAPVPGARPAAAGTREAGGGWALGALGDYPVPALLRQVIDARVDRLGEAARGLLAVAAIVGQAVPLDLWAAVGGAPAADLLDLLDRAARARVLVPSETGGRFAHALIREALYEGVLPPRRRDLHRRVAEALLAGAASPDPDAVAYHFARAGDARAAGWLIRAGERAQRAYAWRTAAARYEAALALTGATGDDAARRILLLRRLAQARFTSAPAAGVAALEEAARLADETGDRARAAVILCELGMVRGGVGDTQRCIRELAAGVAALGALPAGERRALVLEAHVSDDVDADYYRGLLVLRLGVIGRFADALAEGEALVAGLQGGAAGASGITIGHTYSGLATAHAGYGRPGEAQAAARAAYEGYLAAGHLVQAKNAAVRGFLWAALPYGADDPATRARWVAALAEAHARALAIDPMQPSLRAEAYLDFLEGRWPEARALALELLAANHEGERRLAAWVLAALAHAQGDDDLARRAVRTCLAAGPETSPDEAYWYLSDLGVIRTAAAIALDAGDPPAARAWLACHDRWLAWSGAVLGRAEGALGWADYHRAAGDLARARERAEAALAQASEPRQPLALAAARRLLGELAGAAGRPGEAAAHLDAALALAEACAAPHDRALALLARAELRLATGDQAGATADLDAARDLLLALDARPALARADALAGRLAAPVAPAPTALPFGLTAREADVLALLAEGLTGPQIAERLFLSRHTVGSHLKAIYGKLGVTSRAAATRLALEHHLA